MRWGKSSVCFWVADGVWCDGERLFVLTLIPCPQVCPSGWVTCVVPWISEQWQFWYQLFQSSAVLVVSGQRSLMLHPAVSSCLLPTRPGSPTACRSACGLATEPQSGPNWGLNQWKEHLKPRETARLTPVYCSTLKTPVEKNKQQQHAYTKIECKQETSTVQVLLCVCILTSWHMVSIISSILESFISSVWCSLKLPFVLNISWVHLIRALAAWFPFPPCSAQASRMSSGSVALSNNSSSLVRVGMFAKLSSLVSVLPSHMNLSVAHGHPWALCIAAAPAIVGGRWVAAAVGAWEEALHSKRAYLPKRRLAIGFEGTTKWPQVGMERKGFWLLGWSQHPTTNLREQWGIQWEEHLIWSFSKLYCRLSCLIF